MTKTPERHPKYGLIPHWIERATKQGLPGLPPSRIPMVARDDLHAALIDSVVEIIYRPSCTRPGSTVPFIVRTTKRCVNCDTETTETVQGRLGDRTGFMCADCQHWSDGNIVNE